MKMKYKVSISYYDFLFDNAVDAVAFANSAKMHFVSTDRREDITVSIDLIMEKEEEEDAVEL